MAQHNVPSHTGGLHLSSTNKVFAGVCGGLADYFGMNATLLRALWAVVTVMTGILPGIAVYIIAAVVMSRGVEE
jgi:phage shock protein C